MITYGTQMDQKGTGSGLEVDRKCARSGLEVSICPSVHPKHFPCLLDEPYVRDLFYIPSERWVKLRDILTLLFFFVSVRPYVTKNCEMSVRPVSVRPVYTDTYTAYTTQPYTNHTHTPTQPKTQVHSTQSKHTHTPTQPKTHPHSHKAKTHPHSHTAKTQKSSIKQRVGPSEARLPRVLTNFLNDWAKIVDF